MTKKEKVQYIIDELEKLYPRVRHLIFKPSLLEDYREHMKAQGTNLSAYELAMDLENWMESVSVRQKLGFLTHKRRSK